MANRINYHFIKLYRTNYKAIHLLPSFCFEIDRNQTADWGVWYISIEMEFIVWRLRIEYVIDKFNLYD